jgi:hypothetical protein
MAYNANDMKVGTATPTVAPNTRTEGVVIKIEEGTLKDFYRAEALAKFEDRNPEAPAINVVVELKHDGIVMQRGKTITLPPNNLAHPKSTMAHWIKQYGKPPVVGQKVTLVANERGYFEVLC